MGSDFYRLIVEGISVSKGKLLRFLRTLDYIEGQRFEVRVKITNIGDDDFPGGFIYLVIDWPDQRKVLTRLKIDPIKVNESIITDAYKTEPLCRGYGLFFLQNIHSIESDKSVQAYNREGERIFPGPEPRPAFHSIRAKAVEEIYELWSLIVAAFSLIALLYIEMYKMFPNILIKYWFIPLTIVIFLLIINQIKIAIKINRMFKEI